MSVQRPVANHWLGPRRPGRWQVPSIGGCLRPASLMSAVDVSGRPTRRRSRLVGIKPNDQLGSGADDVGEELIA